MGEIFSYFLSRVGFGLFFDVTFDSRTAIVASRTGKFECHMITALLVAYNFSFHYAVDELVRYCSNLNSTQWGILSACAVAFGFLCMKSNDVRKT
ncbi:hypothetical protein UC8_17970 [Roseimaritima ulvae]|uniref:Uncharacterized protein n=2 Tax=Roseimaritima ulvae TaxID=980254 RepID=A0A5B9QPE1_9BACT|nr:hypothetical protein UC8_17970 [Roseimaritima ulvae]